MITEPICYFQGICGGYPKFEVWFEESDGTLVYSRLCNHHYIELTSNGRKFDYVFDLEDS